MRRRKPPQRVEAESLKPLEDSALIDGCMK